mmetsp:Transcript_21439/g.27753  ORF Transcript_21439/g.27753 Transcript_21439/m.27753 type:complete len:339 (+) Transcript_21439:123-1139(+)
MTRLFKNALILRLVQCVKINTGYRGLGPGSMEPYEFRQYPRGKDLLNELVDTVSESRELERLEVRLGNRDLNFLSPTNDFFSFQDYDFDPDYGGIEVPITNILYSNARARRQRRKASPAKLASFAIEIARRWPHGGISALFDCDLLTVKALKGHGIRVSSLSGEAENPGHTIKQNKEDLVLVLDADADTGPHVSHLQALSASLYDSGTAILLLNPKLDIPNPISPGTTMKPLLLSDFVPIYIAQADALEIAAEDAGIGVYRRWPHTSYRLYERRASRYSFLGSTEHQPSDSQLQAVYRAATTIAVSSNQDESPSSSYFNLTSTAPEKTFRIKRGTEDH